MIEHAQNRTLPDLRSLLPREIWVRDYSARQLNLFQTQGNFWNRLRFINKCLMLFEEINGKFWGKLDASFGLPVSWYFENRTPLPGM